MAQLSTIMTMDLAGGAACLDFVNTGLNEKMPVERIHSYEDLLILTGRLSLLDEQTLSALKRLAEKEPVQARSVLAQAREARTAMLNIFQALADDRLKADPPQLLEKFNNYVSGALSEWRFTVQGSVLKTAWKNPEKNLLQPLWSFCYSAYELLNTKDQKLIKQCGACAWLFLDETKNHTRKWCDMQTCGTNQKARRYYRRHQAQ